VTAENVTIRGNRIVDCGKQGHDRILDAGGISINILAAKTDKPVHKNITIENNIVDCPSVNTPFMPGVWMVLRFGRTVSVPAKRMFA